MKFFDDLPEIHCKAHAQAKRLKITVSQNGIRLTYPPKTNFKQIEKFLQQSYQWLIETYQKQQSLQPIIELPVCLNLAYHDRKIDIHYQPDLKNSKYDSQQQILFIPEESAGHHLTQEIIDHAKHQLPQMLIKFAQQHQLKVNKIRIATPTTRWGSCSSKQEIMLHAGLLLMPQHYADYVILHELAHTKHLHHQETFWQLLEEFIPDAKEIQHQVKRWRLPCWWQTKK